MPREANAVDFWRGFALLTIFVNHIPGIYFERFTYRNVSISDSAELFVFLAGWGLALMVARYEARGSRLEAIKALGDRTLRIYAVHLMLITLSIAMLAAAAKRSEER
ncbi:MAG: OpgC domain-containing protein, partial [Hyphomicrobiaceae bacterium]|nr:OpgC domain-containing protein [Hyphomicrobiaceae bacterium]